MKLRLPQRKNIFATGATDPVRYHYLPIVRIIMNQRLKMVLRLLGDAKFHRLLDAGYGSGIMLPELSQRCQDLYGIDIHNYLIKVKEMLRAEGISADLKKSSLTALDFTDEYFDGVVALSVLEFIADLEKAITQIHRVTKKEGIVIIGFPAINILTDFSYLLIGIKDARQVHKSTHRDILREAKNKFIVEKIITFPPFYHWI